MPLLLLVLGFALLVAASFTVAVLMDRHRDRKRREALGPLAVRLGLRYRESVPFSEIRRFLEGVPVLADLARHCQEVASGAGTVLDARHVLSGKQSGLALCCFERAMAMGGDSEKRITVRPVLFVVVRDEGLDLPAYVSRADLMRDPLLNMEGYEKVSDPATGDYTSPSHVFGTDAEAALRLHGPEIRTFVDRRIGLCVEAAGPLVVSYRFTESPDPEEWPRAIDDAIEIHRLLALAAVH